MIPSMAYLRLKHKNFDAYSAEASLVLQVNADEEEFYLYTLNYPNLHRSLKIKCQSAFPYKILEWEEKWNTNSSEKVEVTKAQLQKTIQLPYWELNGSENINYRDSLNLKIKDY